MSEGKFYFSCDWNITGDILRLSKITEHVFIRAGGGRVTGGGDSRPDELTPKEERDASLYYWSEWVHWLGGDA
jgi:hypothetical protein